MFQSEAAEDQSDCRVSDLRVSSRRQQIHTNTDGHIQQNSKWRETLKTSDVVSEQKSHIKTFVLSQEKSLNHKYTNDEMPGGFLSGSFSF